MKKKAQMGKERPFFYQTIYKKSS
jgi:hypothetical protein